MKHAMTIDVEDYFQVSAFENLIAVSDWEKKECRVEANMDKLLQLFADNDTKATFFTLGWIAQRYPQMIKKVVEQGHELASHGTMHQRASAQSQAEFKADVGDAKRLLEDLGGKPVLGYRAPSFSFTKKNLWVYDVLLEEGYKYSSSVYPVVHDHYGIPDAPRERYQPLEGIDEIPLSTLEVFGRNMPISGGGYFRLYPYWMTRWAVSRYTNTSSSPYIFYLHPWELDPEQPRMDNINFKTRFRHYLNLRKVNSRLSALLKDFHWSSMANIYQYQS